MTSHRTAASARSSFGRISCAGTRRRPTARPSELILHLTPPQEEVHVPWGQWAGPSTWQATPGNHDEQTPWSSSTFPAGYNQSVRLILLI